MYQIGEFSYLCETTIKTLRYYDKINLLKPKKIDPFTGYRYYDEEQIITFKKIKELQELNFSLKEIKEILFDNTNELLMKKQKELEEEFSKKIAILEKMNMKENQKINLIKNDKLTYVGVNTIIKSRKDIDKVLKKVDKILNFEEEYPKVFVNYEKGYTEKNIMCFIGRMIPKEIYLNEELLDKFKVKKLYVYYDWRTPSFLKMKVEDTILNTYQTMIEYASKNSIQIRGNFNEITENNETEIIVEAYDLTIENKDQIEHDKRLTEKLKQTTKDSYPEKFIGKWKLEGEITEIPIMFNPKRKHYMPDTELKILELKADGTTNYKNITWKEKFLIVKEDDTIIYNLLIQTKHGRKQYLEIGINGKETSSRPYRYYYKKIK